MSQRMSKIRSLRVALSCLLLSGLAPARAEGVIVNGTPATVLDLLVLVNWNCGDAIADGNYWIDVGSGAWGYAGGQQEGTLPCHSAAAGTAEAPPEASEEQDESPSTFEDRMCARGLCDGVIVNPVYP